MEQNNNPSKAPEVITFPDILRMFKGKAKTFKIAAIVSVIIGAVVGALLSFVFVSYGSSVTFYINQRDGSKTLLPLLQSDSFAEKLLLDENGLPPKSECDPEDYSAALSAVNAYNKAREEKYLHARNMIIFNSEMNVIKNKYNDLLSAYNTIFNELDMYLSAPDEVAKGEGHSETIKKYEGLLAQAKAELDAYKNDVYLPTKAEEVSLSDQTVKIARKVNDARDLAAEKVEKVVAPWREKPEVKEMVSIIRSSVTYEYDKVIADANTSSVTESEDNQNAAFLVINVSVPEDKEAAELIIEKLKLRIPYYIKDHIEKMSGSTNVQVTLSSTFTNTTITEGDGPIMSAAIGAVVCAAVVIVLIFAFVIIKNMLPDDIFEKKEKKSKKNKAAEQTE